MWNGPPAIHAMPSGQCPTLAAGADVWLLADAAGPADVWPLADAAGPADVWLAAGADVWPG